MRRLNKKWWILRKPVIFKSRSVGQPIDKEEIIPLPIWVKLPRLGLNFYSGEGLLKVGSLLGIPLALTKSLRKNPC